MSVVRTFYIIDLDRTLLDTVRAGKIMQVALAEFDPELAADLTKQTDDYSAKGESFSMFDFILERAGEDGMTKIVAHYKELMANQDVINQGGRELIEYIRTSGAGVGILTFGSQRGQSLKIEAAGLGDVPFIVTHETYKGDQIKSWRQPDRTYVLPSEYGDTVADQIVFIDDKPFSFKGLPADARGYWVESIYDAGEESLTDQVKRVSSLDQIIGFEKQQRGE